MNCTNCGLPIKAGEKFCANCGSPIKIPLTEPTTPSAVENGGKKKKPVFKKWWFWVLIVIILLIILIATCGESEAPSSEPADTQQEERIETEDVETAALEPSEGPGETDAESRNSIDILEQMPAPATTIRAGMYLVGKDIPAGTYKLTADGDSGYWERLSDASGKFDAIIANSFFTGTSYVTVNDGEYLKLDYCSGVLQ